MKLLTRTEELALLAVWRLQENAYSLPIKELISEIAGQEWSLASIYTPLERLSKRGLVTSYATEATRERGGRRKRVYKLTTEGRAALVHMHEFERKMWNGVSPATLTPDGDMSQEYFRPPRLAERLLNWLVPDVELGSPLGDFEELYNAIANDRGLMRAKMWYWGQIAELIPDRLFHKAYWGTSMLKNYILFSIRNLVRHVGYSALNLVGLAIGLAAFVVIMLYVQDERSFDQFHENADQIYRVLDFRKVDGIGEESSSAPIPLAEEMLNDFPEDVEAAVRFFDFQAPTLSLSYADPTGELQLYNESKVYFVDAAIFTVFDFPLRAGNSETALVAPNTIVLTPSMASKYFEDEAPMGKTLRFEGQHDLLVTGILAQDPNRTHLDFDFLVSFATLDNPDVLTERLRTHWIWNPSWTYLLLNESTTPASLEAQFPGFVNRHFPESRQDRVKLYLQPVTDIHLTSKLDYEMGPNSDEAYVYIFSFIAVLVLLISSFNFVNLVTARSARRAKEIGMRKVLGGYRIQLIRQFLVESGLTGLAALPLALPLIWVMLPVINSFSGKTLRFNVLDNPEVAVLLCLVALSIGLLAGVYPALYLSRFRPAKVLTGIVGIAGYGQSRLRKTLVVTQFSLSVMLIIGTVVAVQQMDYMQSRNLGFKPEEVVLLPALRSPVSANYAAFRTRLLDHPDILALTTVEDVPGMKHQTGGYSIPGREEDMQFARLIVHDDFAATMGVELAAGRDFKTEHTSDSDDAVIINEAMVRWAGWKSNEEALGQLIDDQSVVGVMKDFNFVSLHRPIYPFVLQRINENPNSYAFSVRYIALRVRSEKIEEVLSFAEQEWFSISPEWPFEYLFLNDLLATQYSAERTLGKVAAAFALLSLIVACLGLFGLAAYMAERRTKEIGIRKVMGATVPKLVLMLSSAFLTLVLIAIMIRLAHRILRIGFVVICVRVSDSNRSVAVCPLGHSCRGRHVCDCWRSSASCSGIEPCRQLTVRVEPHESACGADASVKNAVIVSTLW